MVSPLGNSLLAAQIYSSASQVGSAQGPRVDGTNAQQRAGQSAKQYDEALEAQRPVARAAKPASRAFPADQVELTNASDGRDEPQDVEQRFAREAPTGTTSTRPVAPGTHLDIRV